MRISEQVLWRISTLSKATPPTLPHAPARDPGRRCPSAAAQRVLNTLPEKGNCGLAKWSKKTQVFLTNFTCSNLGPSSTPEGGKGEWKRLQRLFLIYPEPTRLLDTLQHGSKSKAIWGLRFVCDVRSGIWEVLCLSLWAWGLGLRATDRTQGFAHAKHVSTEYAPHPS